MKKTSLEVIKNSPMRRAAHSLFSSLDSRFDLELVPRATTRSIAQLSDSADLRERMLRYNDIDALFEHLAVDGERALQTLLVVQSVRWWRAMLHKQARFWWPPEEILYVNEAVPEACKREEQEDGSLILPDPANCKRARTKERGLFGLSGLQVYYRWRPISRSERKQAATKASEYLRRIGSALAFVGGGATKKLTPKEAKEKTKASKRAYVSDKRVLDYHDKAWKQYEAKKAELLRGGQIDKEGLKKAAIIIATGALARGGDAKREAQQRFIEDVKRDMEILLSKKILQ